MITAPDYEKNWSEDPRWYGIKRDYSGADVVKLRGRHCFRNDLAQMQANRLFDDCRHALAAPAGSGDAPVRALGAMSGNQAVQQAEAGLRAIYASGWQVAADRNLSGNMYPDLSLYPNDSMASLVKALNSAMLRSDQLAFMNGNDKDYLKPIVADAEAGFGGTQCTYEVVKSIIESGAAGVHLEDQLSSAKKCGHLGGKVLVPAGEFIEKLKVARLAADVLGVPTVIIARTDANSARLLTSDIDDRDAAFLTEGRTREGFYNITGGLDMAIARSLEYAPYADMLWVETSKPDLAEAKVFADAIHAKYPGKMLAYNCSPSFNWKANLDKTGDLIKFQDELAKMGYVFQFITLAGFHTLNASMFELAVLYQAEGMSAYSELQQREFSMGELGFRAVKHQEFVGTGYYDAVKDAVSAGENATAAMADSTESDQF